MATLRNLFSFLGSLSWQQMVPLCLLVLAACSDPSGREAVSATAEPTAASAPATAATTSARPNAADHAQAAAPITYNEAIYCSALAERMGRDSSSPEQAALGRRVEARANAEALRLSSGIVDEGRAKTATDVMKDAMDLSVRFSMEEMARHGDEASLQQLRDKRQAEFEVLCGRLR